MTAHSSQEEPNDDPGSSSSSSSPSRPRSSLSSALSQKLYNAFLYANCVLHTPMFSILSCNVIYGTALYQSTIHSRRTGSAFSTTVLARTLGLYAVYCLVDRHQPTKGCNYVTARQREWLRHWPGFRWTAEFFPVTLHKTVDLDPLQQPYIFLYHPHGVISMGANTALNTNGCQFDTIFPGIRRWGVTLNVLFTTPLFRDWLLWMGFVSASKTALTNKLLAGDSIVLVPGGAAEALHAHESNFCLRLRSRRGFIRLALETGAAPVPCLGFGENHVFDTVPTAAAASGVAVTDQYNNSNKNDSPASWEAWLFGLQEQLYRVFSFSVPIVTWPFARQRPIHVVVGAPVRLHDMNDNVEACFAKYTAALQALYDEHKAKYGYANVPLEIL